jgi:hypothetical protein
VHAGWLVAPLLLALAPAAQAASYEIEARGSATGFGSVRSIGDFKPRRDPTLGAAIDAYGPPGSTRPFGAGTGCKAGWPNGVRITFASFGTGDACDPDTGRAQAARVSELDSWHTARSLHIGDRVRKLRRLYPAARRHRSSYWLVTGLSLYGPHPRPYPVLAAAVRDGAVRSFKLEIGAAGD